MGALEEAMSSKPADAVQAKRSVQGRESQTAELMQPRQAANADGDMLAKD